MRVDVPWAERVYLLGQPHDHGRHEIDGGIGLAHEEDGFVPQHHRTYTDDDVRENGVVGITGASHASFARHT